MPTWWCCPASTIGCRTCCGRCRSNTLSCHHLLDQMELLSTQTVMLNCPGNVTDVGVKNWGLRRPRRLSGFNRLGVTHGRKNLSGTISHNGKTTPNDVVSVQVHDDKEPLLRHVKVMREHPAGGSEGSSYPIHIKDPKQVRVLMSSQKCRPSTATARSWFRFITSTGKVLHMISHFSCSNRSWSKAVKNKRLKLCQRRRSFRRADWRSGEKRHRRRRRQSGRAECGVLDAAGIDQPDCGKSRRRTKEMLRKRYSLRVRPDDLALSSDGTAAPTAQSPRLKKTSASKCWSAKANKPKVRDLFGHEGWVQSDALY